MKRPRKSFLIVFVPVLVIGAVALAVLYPKSLVRISDADNNGVAERVVFLTLTGDMKRIDEDLDQNGTVDRQELFEQGLSVLIKADQNMDGVQELTTYFTPQGEWSMLMRDQDADGRIDVVSFYDNGGMPPLGVIRDKDGDGVFEHSRPGSRE
ncbi:MAG: hypothetical protein P9M14_09900 [Candidatus Alcyoniella australis]|nr:hypothetical protein [Candidatus Alcyoniella australis]